MLRRDDSRLPGSPSDVLRHWFWVLSVFILRWVMVFGIRFHPVQHTSNQRQSEHFLIVGFDR